MSGSYFSINQKYNSLLALITGGSIPGYPAAADVVTTNTAQTISAVKTFSALPQSSIVPTTGNDFVNKTYADSAGSSVLVDELTTTTYTSITTNSTWTKLATITNTPIFTGTGNHSLKWGFSSTETNQFNAIMAIGTPVVSRNFWCVYSFDGITWNAPNTSLTLGAGSNLSKTSYNSALKLWFSGSAAIAINASRGYIFSSKNGINWNIVASPTGGSVPATDIATNGTGTFVYIAASGTFYLYQSVGDLGKIPTLVSIPAGGPTSGRSLLWVAGSINKFVLTGQSATLNNSLYSSDGITWFVSPDYGTVIEGNALAVDTAQTLIVAGGSIMKYSTNGVNWTTGTVAGSISDTNSIAYGNNIWVRVGTGIDPVHYSNDGINWILSIPIGLTNGYGVVYYSSIGKWVVVGDGTSTLWTSPDAITWTAITTSDFFTGTTRCNISQGPITTDKNMEVGIVVKDTSTGISQYPLNYGVNGGNGLGSQCVFNSVGGSAAASDTINITSYTAGAMDIEIWGKLDEDTPISYGTTPSLTATISASSF